MQQSLLTGASGDKQAGESSNESRQSTQYASNGVRGSIAANYWGTLNDENKQRFNQRRNLQLAVGILMGVTAGSQYAFGIFSHQLKVSANFSQSDLTTVTTVGTVMLTLNFPAGVLFDYAGPQYVIFSATVLSALGFAIFALIFRGLIDSSVANVAVANGLTNFGVGFLDSSAVMTNLFNFPISRGEVLIIQKTFFGLGSTFLSLSFDAFFKSSQDYVGYSIFVCLLVIVTGGLGAAFTRLPDYHTTSLQNKWIATAPAAAAQLKREMIQWSFELHHNPRLIDRRRMNFGITALFIILILFSALTLTKAFVTLERNTMLGLTLVALLFLLSFFLMCLPITFPAFFDYEWLPDLHPPEELIDKPNGTEPDDENVDYLIADNPEDEEIPNVSSESEKETERSSLAQPRASIEAARDDGRAVVTIKVHRMYHDNTNDFEKKRNMKKPSSPTSPDSPLLNRKVTTASIHSDIALPKALDPSVIPTVNTTFVQSLKHPLIWCFWFTYFALQGTNIIIVQNISQIYTAANFGEYDDTKNSLHVALMGIGNALGRVTAGFTTIFLHRWVTMLKAHQLEAAEMEGSTELPKPPYHKLFASVVSFLPLSPAVYGIVCVMLIIAPPSTLFLFFFLGGLSMGFYLALIALAAREIFVNDVMKHFSFIVSGGVVASILLNRVMFGMWFDIEQNEHPHLETDGSTSCAGTVCYQSSFLVLVGINLLATFASIYIVFKWWRIRRAY